MIPDQTSNTQKFTAYAGTGSRSLEVDANGLTTATKTYVIGKLSNALTISNLVNDSNWSELGIYTGTAITGTSEGQYYESTNYRYDAYSDNSWTRRKNNNIIELGKYVWFSSSTGDAVGDTKTSNQSGWQRLETCITSGSTKGSGTWVVTKAELTKSLTDNNEGSETSSTSIDLVSGKSGRGSIVFGDAAGYADFLFTTAGVVTLITSTLNVFTSLQTGTNHVIIKDNGSNVRITNELGATTIFSIEIKYTV